MVLCARLRSWNFSMSRPDKIQWAMRIAEIVKTRSTCWRRNVGCVLTDAKGRILATGYNGVPAGMQHCKDVHCPGSDMPSGAGLDVCEAIHAEQNALLQCQNVDAIDSCFTTTEPCVHCTKILLNTGCQNVYFSTAYRNSGKDIWAKTRSSATWSFVK